MSSFALPLAALALLLGVTTGSAPAADAPADEVKKLFDAMKAGTYRDDGFPALGWEHVPALVARVGSTDRLKTFPTNPLSSLIPDDCTEGVAAAWLIEGVRKGGKFPSLAASPSRIGDKGENPKKEKVETEQALAEAYQAWWAKVKDMDPKRAREVEPLAGTDLHWY
jgi:hypothetical protein